MYPRNLPYINSVNPPRNLQNMYHPYFTYEEIETHKETGKGHRAGEKQNREQGNSVLFYSGFYDLLTLFIGSNLTNLLFRTFPPLGSELLQKKECGIFLFGNLEPDTYIPCHLDMKTCYVKPSVIQ